MGHNWRAVYRAAFFNDQRKADCDRQSRIGDRYTL
jgi:hypothetical protein